MKKTKYGEDQIAFALRQVATGTGVAEVCRKIGICEATYSTGRRNTAVRWEVWAVNLQRVHRIYVQAGLNLRAKRPRRRKAAAARIDRPILTAPNQLWSMDFVADALFNGQRFRALTVVDNFTRNTPRSNWPAVFAATTSSLLWINCGHAAAAPHAGK